MENESNHKAKGQILLWFKLSSTKNQNFIPETSNILSLRKPQTHKQQGGGFFLREVFDERECNPAITQWCLVPFLLIFYGELNLFTSAGKKQPVKEETMDWAEWLSFVRMKQWWPPLGFEDCQEETDQFISDEWVH